MKKSQTQTKRELRRRGFTLLEVLLVLAILGVIAAMVVPRLIGQQEGAMINTTKIGITGLEDALKLYTVDHEGSYPETLEELLAPEDREGNRLPALLPSIPMDAWGNPFSYRVEADQEVQTMMVARIWSWGPDRQDDDGSGDDINNWDHLENGTN
jgi:general secretion pathway protein G